MNANYGLDLIPNTQDYMRLAMSEMYSDYRFMFMASCLAILCAFELGKQLKEHDDFKMFITKSWTYMGYIVLYLAYGLWSLFHIAKVING